MPPSSSYSTDYPSDPKNSEATPPQETLFLLSICRDEDDAAAVRADLKRSSLLNYKLQHCAQIDDANHLLQVCGFDLAFVRIDDFQDHQGAIDLIKSADAELPIVALVSSRLLNSPEFQLPHSIADTCRIEDLSPTLVANLTRSVLERSRSDRERCYLTQELMLAKNAGELGSWILDVETGQLHLDPTAADYLGFSSAEACNFLDDLLEKLETEDQDRLKRIIDLAIETQDDLQTHLKLGEASNRTLLEICAQYRAGGPRGHATLYGYVKREAKTAEDLQRRIEAANAAIQNALHLRDEAIQTASKELDLLLKKIESIEGKSQPSLPDAKLLPAEPEVRPPAIPLSNFDDSPADNLPTIPTVSESPIPTQPYRAPLEPDALNVEEPAPEEPVNTEAPGEPKESESLSFKASNSIQNVLKTISRQQKNVSENTFPFDFSTGAQPDYTDPNPHVHGFMGAAQRLVSITQIGHKISVTLSIENDGAIECEREKELLFEILRELLTNVVKHARATECIIALFRDEDDWVLQVEDDGVGLENNLVSISTPLNKIGLFRIRTKLALKGGQLDLTPTFPTGLIARARLPVSLSNRDAERA